MGWFTPLTTHVIHSVGPSSKYCTWAGLGIHVGEVSEVLYGIGSRKSPRLDSKPPQFGSGKIFGCCSLTPPSVLKQWKNEHVQNFGPEQSDQFWTLRTRWKSWTKLSSGWTATPPLPFGALLGQKLLVVQFWEPLPPGLWKILSPSATC